MQGWKNCSSIGTCVRNFTHHIILANDSAKSKSKPMRKSEWGNPCSTSDEDAKEGNFSVGSNDMELLLAWAELKSWYIWAWPRIVVLSSAIV